MVRLKLVDFEPVADIYCRITEPKWKYLVFAGIAMLDPNGKILWIACWS
jgi:hypothetical protein